MFSCIQVVYELKKKEIEKARSQLEEGREKGEFKASVSIRLCYVMLCYVMVVKMLLMYVYIFY